jgi:hypothetical protein
LRSDQHVETELEYLPGDPIRIRVSHREQAVTVTDDGGAIERAGRPHGEQAIVSRVAEASRSLYQDLLELGE